MHRRDDGQPRVEPQRVDQLERLLLPPDIERARRLVEQEQVRLLGKRPGEHSALALAAGQRVELAVGELDQIEPRERRLGGRAVVPALAPAYETYGVRPSRTYSRTVIPAGISGICGTTAIRRAQLAPAKLRHRVTVDRDRARVRGQGRRPRAGASTCRRRSARSAATHSPRSTENETPSTTLRPPSSTVTRSAASARHTDAIRRRCGGRRRRTARRRTR